MKNESNNELKDNELKVSKTTASPLEEAQILVFILGTFLHDKNPSYLSVAAYKVMLESQERLTPILNDLDKNLTVNDLIISVLSKDKFH